MQLQFGPAPGKQAEPLSVGPVTVFVGPNNSGKSKVLSEIEQFCRKGHRDANDKLLQDLTFNRLSPPETSEAITQLLRTPEPNQSIPVDHIIIGSKHGRYQTTRPEIEAALTGARPQLEQFAAYYLSHNTIRLDGSSRIHLVNPQGAGDLQRSAENSLQVLFRDNNKRANVRRIVFDAFESFFVIDPTLLGQFRIRLSNRAPNNEIEERGVHDAAVNFHSAASPIDLASDGVKAFTGIILELIAGDPRILLIDEPEAFLHPALAFKLGLEVSKAAMESNKHVFASTHSPSFVMGCVQSGAPVNIIRLTYRGGTATSRVLSSHELLLLMRNPLLRSTGILGGLFYEFVVVTESDADRAFYQEMNERLLRFSPAEGIPNCLFINAQNKQTVHTILRPLRKLGIPAAAVVDIDIVKEGGSVWSNLLEAGNLPEINKGALATLRSAIRKAMDATGKDMKREGGIDILSGPDREAAVNLLGQLRQYGLFVVPGGELESWMLGLGVTGHGPHWLIRMFERMGEDPDTAEYVRPNEHDVWAFLRQIKTWLTDSQKLGIPP